MLLFIFTECSKPINMAHIVRKRQYRQHNVKYLKFSLINAPNNDQLAILCHVTYKIYSDPSLLRSSTFAYSRLRWFYYMYIRHYFADLKENAEKLRYVKNQKFPVNPLKY